MKNTKKSSMRKLYSLLVVILLTLTPIYSAFATDLSSYNFSSSGGISLSVDLPDYASSDSFRFNGTTVPGAIVEVYVNGVSFHNDIADSEGVFLFSRVLLDDSVVNNVTVIATNDGLSNAVSKLIKVDDINPEFVSKTNLPSSHYESSIDFKFNLSEPCDVYVEIESEDEVNDYVIGTNISGDTYSISLEDGINYVEIKAIDVAGNELIYTKTINVDTIPPDILETNLDAVSPTYSRDVTIRGIVSEPATVRITINGDKNSNYQCSDGKDNDNDGKVDYPNDLGCNSPDDMVEEQASYNYDCSDGIDNDGDGSIDFPYDLGCDNPQDNNEVDYNGSETQCSDGVDNDNDGLIDFNPNGGGDWGCSGLGDENEGDDPDLGKVYTVSTDNDGEFSKEITLPISIMSNFNGAPSVAVKPNAGETSLDFATAGEDNSIELVAIDSAGLRSTEVTGNIEYTTCNSGDSDFIIVQKDIYPTSLIPDHIFQGLAQVSFSLELDYLGMDSSGVQINGISFSTRDLSEEDEEEWDLNLFDPGQCIASPSSSNYNWYVSCNLKRYPADAYRNITKAYDDFKEQETAKLPVDLMVNYQVTEIYVDSSGQRSERTVTKTQKVCYDLEYLLDIRLDPDDLPRGLLNKTVQLMDKTIELIDQILPLVTQAKWAVAVGCFGMMVIDYFSSLGSTASCLGIEKVIPQIDMAIKGSPDYSLSSNDKYEVFKEALTKELGDESDNLDSCISVREQMFQKEDTRNWLCDRIFCPAVPSAQKYQNEEKSDDLSPCSSSFILKTEGENKLRKVVSASFEGEEESMCENDYVNQWEPACPGIDPLKDSWELEGGSGETSAAGALIKGLANCQFGGNNANANSTLYQSNGHGIVRERNEGQDGFKLANIKSQTEIDKDKKLGKTSSTYTERTVQGLEKDDDGFDSSPYLGSNGECAIAKPSIMDSDKFDDYFNEDPSSVFVSSSKAGETDEELLEEGEYLSVYELEDSSNIPDGYKVDGVDEYYADKNGQFYYRDSDGVVRTTKTMFIKSQASNDGKSISYGSYLADPGNASANANCFDNEVIGQYKNDQILVDPTSSVINSIRCVCLPAIEGYLTSIRNIASLIKNCFESVLVTGEYATGMCKAVFTQYLCDFVFDLLGCVVDTFGGDGQIEGMQEGAGIKGLFTDLKDAGERIKKSTSKRYGDSASFQTLFNERQIIHSLCLAAFGYDWKPDLMSAMSTQSGAIGINSTGMIAPATRRFMSSNPTDGSVNFMYHIGYFLSAGGPVNWRLELICSSSYDCDPNNFENGKCDCAQTNIDTSSVGADRVLNNPYNQNTAIAGSGVYSNDRTRQVDGGVLQGGETVGGGGNPYTTSVGTTGNGDLYIQLNDPVRYDKVRLCYYATTENGKSGCVGPVSISQEGGKSPFTCTFSLALGKYTCGYYSDGSGTVYINDIREIRNGQVSNDDIGESPYGWGDVISYQVGYSLISPNDENALQGIAYNNDFEDTDKFLRARFTDENGKILLSDFNSVELDSTGTIYFPQDSGLTPRKLVGEGETSFDIIGSSSEDVHTGKISGTEFTANNLEVNVLQDLGVKGSGSNDNLLIFYSDGKDKMKFAAQPVSSISAQVGDTYQLGTDAVARYVIENKNVDTIFKDVNNFNPSADEFTIDSLGTRFELRSDISGATKTNLFITYFEMRASSSETLEERCDEANEGVLDWNVKFTLYENTNEGGTRLVKSNKGDTEKTVPLKISCNERYSGETNSRSCTKFRELGASECMCGNELYKPGSSTTSKYCYPDKGGTVSSLHTKLPTCGTDQDHLLKASDYGGDSNVRCGYNSGSCVIPKEGIIHGCGENQFVDVDSCLCESVVK